MHNSESRSVPCSHLTESDWGVSSDLTRYTLPAVPVRYSFRSTGCLASIIRKSLEPASLRVKDIVSGISTDIVAAGQGLENNLQPSIPLKKSQPNSKPADEKNAAAEGKVRRAVTRIVRDGALVHCHLACGHMLTLHKGEVSAPSSMECWACEAERNCS
jgi:hypothetical protein